MGAPLPLKLALAAVAHPPVVSEPECPRWSPMPGEIQTPIQNWWARHGQDVVASYGYEVAVHVHASAVSAAAANVEAGVLSTTRPPEDLDVFALHSLSLKWITGDEQALPVLQRWAAEHFWDTACGLARMCLREIRFLKAARYSMRRTAPVGHSLGC